MPTNSLDDLKGKRIRASNRTEYTVLKALGMTPKSIPINEVADAINSGAIDGATASLEVLVDFGLSRALGDRLPIARTQPDIDVLERLFFVARGNDYADARFAMWRRWISIPLWPGNVSKLRHAESGIHDPREPGQPQDAARDPMEEIPTHFAGEGASETDDVEGSMLLMCTGGANFMP